MGRPIDYWRGGDGQTSLKAQQHVCQPFGARKGHKITHLYSYHFFSISVWLFGDGGGFSGIYQQAGGPLKRGYCIFDLDSMCARKKVFLFPSLNKNIRKSWAARISNHSPPVLNQRAWMELVWQLPAVMVQQCVCTFTKVSKRRPLDERGSQPDIESIPTPPLLHLAATGCCGIPAQTV